MLRKFYSSVAVKRLQVFSQSKDKGNAAGVIQGFPNDTARMQAIAKQVALPATAFILPAKAGSDTNDSSAALRFFTPTGELDVCGHGALAAASRLFGEGRNKMSVDTNKSKLALAQDSDGLVTFSLKHAEKTADSLPADEILDLLGITLVDVDGRLPMCVAAVGLRILLVPMINRDRLFQLKLNRQGILDWTKRHEVAAMYVYTKDTIYTDSAFHARCFNPRFNSNFEDVATGAAAAALASIYSQENVETEKLVIEQGTLLGSESRIHAFITPDSVKIGGYVTFHSDMMAEEQVTMLPS